MRQPYIPPVTSARPDVGLPEPRVQPFVLGLARLVSGAYLRLALGIERVGFRGSGELVGALSAAYRGDVRLVIAFRHAYGAEPELLSWALSTGAEREARRLGVRFPRRSHAVFVHGYEVARWGGPFIRWILPRAGAMPVHHSKLDSAGMHRIRAAIKDGPYPVALSPEGQTSYSSETVPRLEQGAIRLGFMAADSLERDGRAERVALLPVSVHFRYGPRAAGSLERLVKRLEAFAGAATGLSGSGGRYRERLSACLSAMLALAEGQYSIDVAGADRIDDDTSIARRIEAITLAAFDSGERLLGIARGPGDSIERLYRIRQAGWDRVFLDAGHDPRLMAPLERAIADRRAGEAWYAMRHMELADLAWYLRSAPPPDGSPFHAVVEYAQNMWDFANRLAGGAFPNRINVTPRRAVVVVAPRIDLSDRLPAYRNDKRRASADALSELESAYLDCIKEIRNEG